MSSRLSRPSSIAARATRLAGLVERQAGERHGERVDVLRPQVDGGARGRGERLDDRRDRAAVLVASRERELVADGARLAPRAGAAPARP